MRCSKPNRVHLKKLERLHRTVYPFELVAYRLATNETQLPPDYVQEESLDAMYTLLRMAPHVARTAIREPWVDSAAYKEFLLNKLKMAQIDLISKLQMDAINAKNLELKKRFQW